MLITGGGSGIGAAVAVRLCGSHSVVISGRRLSHLERVGNATGAIPLVADVADPQSAPGLVQTVIDRFGRIDALVLNAGIVRAAPVGDMSLEDWNAQIATNLTALFVLAKTALPHLLERRGSIVTISSTAAATVGAGMAAYSASKAGATLLTQTIAYEYARFGLRANIIAPGWVRTEMSDLEMAAFGDGDLERASGRVTALVPARRTGNPEEIAEAVAWLLSPAASYVNGAVLNIDGAGSVVNAGLTAFDKV